LNAASLNGSRPCFLQKMAKKPERSANHGASNVLRPIKGTQRRNKALDFVSKIVAEETN